MHPLLGVLISYLAGSIPFAYLAGKARGIDLRMHGSGNLGASNAVRVLGPRIGALVYFGDTVKGLLPVATAGGVFLGLAWLPTTISAAVFIVVLGLFRISSVASLSAAVTLPIAILVTAGPQSPLFIMSLAVLALVIWTHRSNIRRLRRGEEPRIGRKAEVSAQ